MPPARYAIAPRLDSLGCDRYLQEINQQVNLFVTVLSYQLVEKFLWGYSQSVSFYD